MPFRPLVSGRNHISLQIKLAAFSAILLFISFALGSFFLIRTNIENEKRSLISEARVFSQLSTPPLGEAYSKLYDSGQFRFREIFTDVMNLNSDVSRIQIIGVDGLVLFDSIALGSTEEINFKLIEDQNILMAVKANKSSEVKSASGQVQNIIVPYSDDFGSRPFSLRFFVTYESIYDDLNKSIMSTIALAFFASIIVFLLMMLLVNRTILSPLSKIVNSARNIREGDLKTSIALLDRNDELGDLAISLNHMTNKLKKNITDLKDLDKLKDEFIFLASHELRTPLTIIKGYITTLISRKDMKEDIRSELLKVDQSSKALEETIESLLSLVSLEEEPILSKKIIEFPKIIESVISNLSTKAREKNLKIHFNYKKNQNLKILVNEVRIFQAFFSILDNAVKFSREEGVININLEKKGKSLLISIEDQGIGIPENEKNKVFQKFHRATDVLKFDYEGLGLNLYLTNLIISAHQGKLWFNSKINEGTTFFVTLPIKEE